MMNTTTRKLPRITPSARLPFTAEAFLLKAISKATHLLAEETRFAIFNSEQGSKVRITMTTSKEEDVT